WARSALGRLPASRGGRGRGGAHAGLPQLQEVGLQPVDCRALIEHDVLEGGDAAAEPAGRNPRCDWQDERDRQEDEAEERELQTGSSYATLTYTERAGPAAESSRCLSLALTHDPDHAASAS